MSDPGDIVFHATAYATEEIAFRLCCAFIDVDHRTIPPIWWLQPPSETTKAAWLRVAAEARLIFGSSDARTSSHGCRSSEP